MANAQVQDNEFEDVRAYYPAWNPTVDANKNARTEAKDHDYIDGYYVDMKEGVGENKQTVYVIQTESGERFSVWGSFVLNDLMSEVSPGEFLRIRWKGKQKNENGNKTYHTWAVMRSKIKPQLSAEELGKSKKVSRPEQEERKSPPAKKQEQKEEPGFDNVKGGKGNPKIKEEAPADEYNDDLPF